MTTYREIAATLAASGLTARGAFHPDAGDGVPAVAPGHPARTLVLAGNAGPAMWQAFSRCRDPDCDVLDGWSRDVLAPIAGRIGAIALFPSQRPYLPFQRWAMKAESCHASPLGVLIHAEYGLWHGYRGALALAERLDLPRPARHTHPCADCVEQPCLSRCPIAAFGDGRYDVPACAAHLATAAGADCLAVGCRPRRACPIGQDHRYQPAQAGFHMRHFLRRHGGQPASDQPN